MDFHLQSSWRFHLCTLKIPCYFLHIKKQLFQQEQVWVFTWLLLLDLVEISSGDTSPSGIPGAILSRKRHEQEIPHYFSWKSSVPRPHRFLDLATACRVACGEWISSSQQLSNGPVDWNKTWLSQQLYKTKRKYRCHWSLF